MNPLCKSTCALSCTFALLFACAATAQDKVIVAKGAKGKPATELPNDLTETLNVVYANAGKRELHLDLFAPKNKTESLPAIVVVHGGGWLNGNKTKFRAMAIALAKRGYVTAAVEYRLGGEAKFPAGIQDCNSAVRYLRANAKKHGIDPKRIGAVGGSAGGHLVGLMATAPHVKEFQANGNLDQTSNLQAAIVLAGPLELATGPVAEKSRKNPKNSNANKWLGKTIDEAPDLYKKASPFTHVSKSTPPILFMAGDKDHPERNSATRAKLKQLNVPTGIVIVKDGNHGCWNREPFFSVMVEEMDRFFRPLLK